MIKNVVYEVFPPHGEIELVKWTGTDLDVVNAARVSFHKTSNQIGKEDKGLIKFLMKNGHGSPFEQGFLSLWRIRLPVFVMREWMRHRIGYSINEESGRYVEYRRDFYMPEYIREQEGKPGSYTFTEVSRTQKDFATEKIRISNNVAWSAYRAMLDAGIAKEQARIVLPQNLYTEIRWTCNARSLMHFLSLRNQDDAMYEIRKYAEMLEGIFLICMPHTAEAFIENNRVAP